LVTLAVVAAEVTILVLKPLVVLTAAVKVDTILVPQIM
jgi:hypothetical protein